LRRLFRHRALAALAAAALSPAANAHVGGKAQPRIAASLSGGEGLAQTLTVRLTDLDSGEAIEGASVSAFAQMTSPHVMRTAPWALAEQEPGLYQGRVRFLMPASWLVRVRVDGTEVVPATAELPVEIERASAADSAATEPAAGGVAGSEPGEAVDAGQPSAGLTPLPTRLEDTVTSRDAASIAILWIHGLAAVAWVVGVLVMVLALGTSPGPLVGGWRAGLAGWYRSWGAWLHWGFVPLIVLTGVYNMLWVTPFPLAWSPSDFEALADVPYGPLYEAILVVKLGLFVALLITGTQVLRRTVRPVRGTASPPNGFVRTLAAGLGPSGVFYLLTVPLILGAAPALRYVHILSHVAEVLQAQGAP
jgi:hypothetical protein